MAVRGRICLVSTDRQMMDKHGVAHPHHWNDSALKRKEVLTPATPWMNLEDTMCSELHIFFLNHHDHPFPCAFLLYKSKLIVKIVLV